MAFGRFGAGGLGAKMAAKYPFVLLLSGTVLVLDQATKLWVHGTMPLYHSLEIVPNFLRLTYVRNTGAAFGFLAGGDRSILRIFFFLAVSAVAIGCIVYLLHHLRPGRKATAASLSLILGGAMGNLLDRLRLGEVIDFIDLHYYDLHWPAFNVADTAITLGVLLLMRQILTKQL